LPSVPAANKQNDQCRRCESKFRRVRRRFGRRRGFYLRRDGCNWRRSSHPTCESVFGEKAVFLETQIPGHGSDKTSIKNTARQQIPCLVFEGLEETDTYARGCGNLLKGDAAHFALTF